MNNIEKNKNTMKRFQICINTNDKLPKCTVMPLNLFMGI